MASLQPAVLPSESEISLAKTTSKILAASFPKKGPVEIRVIQHPSKKLELPLPAVRLLLRILEEMAQGNAVTLIPIHAELTTQEASELLNISRPSLIQLLNVGRIAYRKVGTHRRIRFESLMAYKRQSDTERKSALKELTAYDQELRI